MSDLTFEQIVETVPRRTVWATRFDMEDERLQSECPDAHEVEDIGRCAWERLTEADQEFALEEMFYAYWENRQQQYDDKERWEREKPLKTQLQPLLAQFGDLLAVGRPVSFALVAEIAQLTHQLMGGEGGE